MRVKAIKDYQEYGGDGITPAGAGKSLETVWVVSKRRDHPRRCG
ncbi:hypothetical protein LPICM02_240008 [Pseudolactococcus piscium]|nr:hypothetical protein LPICM02_240008 [Lactococcus piscium]